MPRADRSVVGDLINFRGLVYAPLNENGVIFLFGKVAGDLNMYVEEIKPGFPDCIARRFTGKGWERVTVEFEFRSKNFLDHGHNAKECDLIVCWEHNWPDCPLEVIELRAEIKGFPNKPIPRPDTSSMDPDPEEAKKKLFLRRGTPPAIQALYEALEAQVLAIDKEVWRKVSKQSLSFYSPERVFVSAILQKSQFQLHLFTRGEPMDGVQPFGYDKEGHKWGRFTVKCEADIPAAVSACKEALKRVQAALAANEPTNWFAQLEEPDEEPTDAVSAGGVEPEE